MENKENKYNFFRFEDLRIYRKALDYSKWINKTTAGFPTDNVSEHLRLSFVKAAIAISVNIAEGSGRNKSQFVYYLKIAKSAIRECVVLTTITFEEDLLSQEAHDESRETLIEISKMIGALISSLQRSKRQEHNSDREDEIDDDENIMNTSFDDEFDLNTNL